MHVNRTQRWVNGSLRRQSPVFHMLCVLRSSETETGGEWGLDVKMQPGGFGDNGSFHARVLPTVVVLVLSCFAVP